MAKIPSYRLHSQSGQAVVCLRDYLGKRHDILLGKHGSPESHAEYARLIGEWTANGGRMPPRKEGNAPRDLTVSELLLLFFQWAEGHYLGRDGKPTNEVNEVRLTIKVVRSLYGHTLVKNFGPLSLKAVRQRMIEMGLCRNLINQRIGRARRMFKWGVSEELCPSSVYEALRTVEGLRRGKSKARETAPVKPVPDEVVERTLPHLHLHLATMVRLQRITGMRSGELCGLCLRDLDRTGPVWFYSPASHKTAHHGHVRVVAIGPKGQALLQPLLDGLRDDEAIFSPARAMRARKVARRALRKTKVQPSQVDRSKARPKRPWGTSYSTRTYLHAVWSACKRAGVENWHPHQLRHSFGTEVRKELGLEAAQVGLGHESADITQHYARRDLALAVQIAEKLG